MKIAVHFWLHYKHDIIVPTKSAKPRPQWLLVTMAHIFIIMSTSALKFSRKKGWKWWRYWLVSEKFWLMYRSVLKFPVSRIYWDVSYIANLNIEKKKTFLGLSWITKSMFVCVHCIFASVKRSVAFREICLKVNFPEKIFLQRLIHLSRLHFQLD